MEMNGEYVKGLSYRIKFSIPYKVDFGQSLAVTGDVPELGSWGSNIKAMPKLTWSDGDVWVSSEPHKFNHHIFTYKYVVLRNNKIERWEECENRKIQLDEKLNVFAQSIDCIDSKQIIIFEDKWDQVVGNIKAQQIIIEEIPLVVSPTAKAKH